MGAPGSRRARGLVGPLLAAALVLAPLASLAIPAALRIPRARDARPWAPAARAVFSHRSHEPLRCYQCHPSFFPQALVPFTHAEMDQGRFCGGCHDGQRATAVAALPCEGCHAR
jgi:c(7)-type cytochrome triheme protein